MTDKLDLGEGGDPRRSRWFKGHYTLVGQTPVPESDPLKWAMWFEKSGEDRIVARTEVAASLISTVFLGLDHNFTGIGPPILFETMVFSDGDGGGDMHRCSTWLEAEAQHGRVVKEWSERWGVAVAET